MIYVIHDSVLSSHLKKKNSKVQILPEFKK